MKKKVMLLFMFLAFTTSSFAYRPIYFNRAATLKQNTLTMRMYYVKTWFSSMYDKKNNQMVDLPDTINLNFNAGNLFLSYGVLNRLTIGLNSVYFYKELENPFITKTAAGLGDLSSLIKVSIIKKKNFFFSTALFVKWNNGKYKDLTKNELPLGTGTIDISVKPLIDVKLSSVWFYIIPAYTLAGKNDIEDKGDTVSLAVTSSFPVPGIKKLYGELSVNGNYKFEDKDLSGNIKENTETYAVSAAPGLQYAITKKLFLQTLGEIMIINKEPWGRSLILKTGLSYKF